MGQGAYIMLGWGFAEEIPELADSEGEELADALSELGIRTPRDGSYGAVVPILVSDPVIAKWFECLLFSEDAPVVDIATLTEEDGMISDARDLWNEARAAFPWLPEGRLLLVSDFD